jgi:CRP/FNR family cyclic AMP-dependent transcriptional regulator
MDPDNLRAVYLFADMTDDDLRRIAAFASEDSVPAGATLTREGDFSNDMVAIESGTADVIKGDRTVGSLGPGDVFGEMGLLGRQTRSATIVSSSPMRLIRLTSWDVKRLPKEVRERMGLVAEQRRQRDRDAAGG